MGHFAWWGILTYHDCTSLASIQEIDVCTYINSSRELSVTRMKNPIPRIKSDCNITRPIILMCKTTQLFIKIQIK